MKKPWVQLAIDTLNIEDGIYLADMSVRIGVDWIEVGTPLIVYDGIDSIAKIVDHAAGLPVIADLKAADAVYKYFAKASQLGAKAAVVLGVMDNGTIREAVRSGNENKIEVIADMLAVPHDKIPERAKMLEKLGVNYVMIHLGFDEMKYDASKKTYDMVEEVVSSVKIPVGVGTLRIEDALESVKRGASWVVQGNPILSESNPEVNMGNFVKTIHELR
jgi:3-hexulose-6-phosphate synthase/6-phospho-3-hexuloisomerase